VQQFLSLRFLRSSKGEFTPHLIALCMFFTGASGLCAEYLLATVSAYIEDSSIVATTRVMGTMLCCMGLGAGLERYWGWKISLFEKLVLVECSLCLLCALAPTLLYQVSLIAENFFGAIQYTFIAAIALLIGLEIPLVINLLRSLNPEKADNLGYTLGMDYVGCGIGTVAFVILIGHYSLERIALLIASLNFSVVILVTTAFWLRLCPRGKALCAIVVTITTIGLLLKAFTL